MTRIIAGTLKGRTLQVPPSGTRPTSERVREAMFSRLEHMDVIEGARVLDLYAGSGALGFEALSRGADQLTLVDSANSEKECGLGCSGQHRYWRGCARGSFWTAERPI